MQENVKDEDHQCLPGELERLRLALLTNQDGLLTAMRARLARLASARGVELNAIDDVVQETLLEAWRHLERLHSPAGFHAWIDEICRNVCRRYAKRYQANLLRHKPFPWFHQDDASVACEEEISSSTCMRDSYAPDPFEALNQQELALLLDRALGALPQEARQLVEMCHLLELPHVDVAGQLGISVGALETRLHRARQRLRQVLSGPLYQDAASFGLTVDRTYADGWLETRLWCSICGRCRLQGSFIGVGSGEKVNLHLRCPDCSQRYGLDTMHSMGLVPLGELQSFRPAWKRTLQGLTELVLQALHKEDPVCPRCGNLTFIQVVDAEEDNCLPSGPYRFWIRWSCDRCKGLIGIPGSLPSVDQLVYWSHPQTRQFMMEHSRWLSKPGNPLEYAGQPALRFQIADMGSAASITVLTHHQTLRVLAVY